MPPPRSIWRRPRLLLVALAAALALAAAVPLAGADPLPTPDEFPKVAFVARNDVPFDALTVGPVAGALGGITVITSPTALSDAARDALVAFGPDLVVIAGGTAAISQAVEDAIAAAGTWDVTRKAGAGRDQTAAELATLLTDLGAGRPAISGDGQIVGDVHVGGTLHVDELSVQTAIDHTEARGVAVFGARVLSNGTLFTWFNRAGGLPTADKTGTGFYTIEVPGLSGSWIAIGRTGGGASGSPGSVSVGNPGPGEVQVRTFNADGDPTDSTFDLVIFDASPDG